MGGTRVLLFGASGFVGARVEAALLEDPRVGELIRVGRRDTGEPNRLRHDLASDGVDRLADLLRETSPGVVINCTGSLGGDTTALVRANVVVTSQLVAAMTVAAPMARLVALGSAAEYGVIPFGKQVSEDAYEAPVSAYGVTKLASTGLIRVAVRKGDLDAVVLRPFNPIGPGVPLDSVLGRAAVSIREALEAGRDHIVMGPLGAYRDFVDVRDVATAITAAALAPRLGEPVLNVGTGVATTTRDAVGMLAESAGFKGRVVESNPAPDRSASVNWIAADTSRITRTLGWAPTHDLPDSVAACWSIGV